MTESYGGGDNRLGDYRLDSILGRGGMGVVYRATDTRRGRVVALKLLPAHLAKDASYRSRFERESRIAAALGDPHIVPIHDWGEIDGTLFLDMRLVDGESLGDRFREALRIGSPPSLNETVAVIEQIASALDHAHAAGLVHRDVKPDNILIDSSGFAYLTDFGIAQSLGDPRLTATGTTIGSIAYMAPERFSNVPIDGGVDVYSLACILFEGITGRPPFGTGDYALTMRGHLFDAIPTTATSLDEVISRGLAKAPGDRYSTARAFAAAARAAIDGQAPEWQPTQQAPAHYRVSERPPKFPLAPPHQPTIPAPSPPPPPMMMSSGSSRSRRGGRFGAIVVAATIFVVAAVAGTILALRSSYGPTAEDAPLPIADESTSPNSPMASCRFTPAPPTGRSVPAPQPDQPTTDLGSLTFVTSGGNLRVQLNEGAPCNAAALTTLAKSGFFDGSACSRVSSYILMCGAAPATPGSTDIQSNVGSPGWTSPDEFPTALSPVPGKVDGIGRQQVVYPVGTVAMANPNAADSSSGDGGSAAFFITVKPVISAPVYSVVGTIDADGLRLAESVSDTGFIPTAPGSYFGLPKRLLTISQVNVG
ncbi:MAG: protein kinase [Gordonia sp. (in: high G+C Gram-positive bacteria)]